MVSNFPTFPMKTYLAFKLLDITRFGSFQSNRIKWNKIADFTAYFTVYDKMSFP